MGNETWRPIPSLNGIFEASSFGRIRRAVATNSKTWSGRLLRATKGSRYYVVTFSVKGKTIQRLIHRLVAEAFHGPPPTTKHQVNHIDGDRLNNRADNLEWVTPMQNQLHAARVLGRRMGESHHRSKLTQATVDDIRNRYSEGQRVARIGKDLGIDYHHVWDICNHRSWTKTPKRKQKPDRFAL